MIMAIMGENIHSFSIFFESGESPILITYCLAKTMEDIGSKYIAEYKDNTKEWEADSTHYTLHI